MIFLILRVAFPTPSLMILLRAKHIHVTLGLGLPVAEQRISRLSDSFILTAVVFSVAIVIFGIAKKQQRKFSYFGKLKKNKR